MKKVSIALTFGILLLSSNNPVPIIPITKIIFDISPDWGNVLTNGSNACAAWSAVCISYRLDNKLSQSN